jgi:hypothetical protein
VSSPREKRWKSISSTRKFQAVFPRMRLFAFFGLSRKDFEMFEGTAAPRTPPFVLSVQGGVFTSKFLITVRDLTWALLRRAGESESGVCGNECDFSEGVWKYSRV